MTESGFRRYMHIEHLYNEEVDGIYKGKCYIFPKLDGSNGSAWLEHDDETGEYVVKQGSRNRALTLEYDNAGFYAHVMNNESIKRYLTTHPTHIVYGEWMVKHTIKDYVFEVWNNFYVFDVYDSEKERYLTYDEYMQDIKDAGLLFISPLCTICDAESMGNLRDKVVEIAENNHYLMEEGFIGEGVVIKNYEFVNTYGRNVYAKHVRNEFKNKSRQENKGEEVCLESIVVKKFCTPDLIKHEFLKFKEDNGGFSNKDIQKFLGIQFHEFIVDYMFEIIKISINLKAPVDFRKLRSMVFDEYRRAVEQSACEQMDNM